MSTRQDSGYYSPNPPDDRDDCALLTPEETAAETRSMLAQLAADEEWIRNVRQGLDELGLHDVPVSDLMGTVDPETGRYVSSHHWTDPHFGVPEEDQRRRTPQEQAEYLHRMLADWAEDDEYNAQVLDELEKRLGIDRDPDSRVPAADDRPA